MPTFPTTVDLSDLGSLGFSFSQLEVSSFDETYRINVSSAGDINGDGFADILIGAPCGPYPGTTYVVYGKASPFTTVDLAALDGNNGFRMSGGFYNGLSVASVGDVNGDGFADFATTVIRNYSQTDTYIVFGKVTGIPAAFDVTTLSAEDGFKISTSNAFGGGDVASAGDVNGDGLSDLIVTSESNGKAYVVFGTADGFGASVNVATLNGTNGFTISGIIREPIHNQFGSAGDVNGDGFDDIIIGDASGFNGAAYVIFGKASAFAADIHVASLNGTNGFRLEGYGGFINSAAHTGVSVSSAGDINGDGFDDMIVGAENGLGYGDVAKAYIVFGTGSGFPTTIVLPDLDGTNGFALRGLSTGDLTGHSVAAAGDLNGDGFADIIVGAPGVNESYVLYGKASPFAASLSVDDIDGTNGFTLSGGTGDVGSGWSVASAGDINGDGAPDLIIASAAGKSHVVFGISPEDTTVAEIGTNRVDVLYGGMSDDNLIGRNGNDRLYGLGGDDVLSGGDGNDVLAGGAGDDTMAGGNGIDTAYFAAALSGVTANLTTGMATSASTGNDLMSGVENLTGSSFNDVLTGDGGANVLSGGDGNDKLYGLAGIDMLLGGKGNDTLDGGAGADTMDGGAGNDTYYVDDLADTVIDSAGNDTIRASANYTLATGLAIETLRVSGTTGRTLTGNELANALYGNIGVDHLIGGMGNDRLDGGLGADTLDGGDGNDTYIVDNAADVVIDSSGKDTIRATASYTLADDVAIEIMSVSGTDGLTLTGNNLANEIYGGVGNDHLVGAGGNDRLDGGLGVDTLDGGDGNDTYIVDNAADIVIDSSGKDTIRATASYTLADGVAIEIMSVSGVDGLTLTGNNLANEMYGGVGDDHLVGAGGNDRLDGGLGADTMDGGAGNDTFYVDDANDVVIDSSGKDTIRAKTSYTLADGVAIEVMRVSGTDGLHLTGNNLANEMYGGVGDDYLAGAGGNDRLEGGFGADTMEGGAGDDLYIVDDGGDWVIEAAGAGSGIDTVRASTSYELTANVENLLLTGTGDFEGWGNALNNALTGNGGHNVLDGGLGNDILNGGGGGDTFRFSTEPGTNNVDTIVAFDHAVDTIQFDSALFLAFPAGELEAGAFNTGTTATDEDDRVLFDAATGGLYYDADGVGGVEAVQFATILTVIGTLDHTDFFVT